MALQPAAPAAGAAAAPIYLQPVLNDLDTTGASYVSVDDRGSRIIVVRGDTIELRPLAGGAPPQARVFITASSTEHIEHDQ